MKITSYTLLLVNLILTTIIFGYVSIKLLVLHEYIETVIIYFIYMIIIGLDIIIHKKRRYETLDEEIYEKQNEEENI
jgi:hypothetical protein